MRSNRLNRGMHAAKSASSVARPKKKNPDPPVAPSDP
jgi:hypothetical protein